MDVHTHFLRDDTRLEGFVRSREAVGKAGWNPELAGKPQTLDDLKYPNWFKEIYLDSDTKVALISGSPSEDPRDWFLTNDMKLDARTRVNQAAGSRRCLSHAIFTPGYPGWMDEVDRAIATLKPDFVEGLHGRRQHQQGPATHPWRMDDEKLVYPFYEKIVKAGHDIVCVHKGLYPPSTEQRFPNLTGYATVDDVGKAAKDWPQIRFVIYHSAFRWTGGPALRRTARPQFEKTGRVEWTSDLAEIPAKYGVSNVYGDLGQIFAQTAVVEPRLCAALMGMLIKGLGADHVVWGTDALWTGAPQWQIEGLRRLEIPEDMRKKYGFAAARTGRRPGQARHLRRELGQDVPLRGQEGGMARRSLRRHQVGLRAARPRPFEPALRLRGAPKPGQLTGYGIVGFGRIGRRLAARLPGAAAILVRPSQGGDVAALVGADKVCTTLDAFIARTPSVAIECASAQALIESGPALLAAGIDLVPLSLTAFADREVERHLIAAAIAGPGRLEIAPGAIGTLDLLAAAREEGLRRVVYRQLKSPQMWELTPARDLGDLATVRGRRVFFKGSVREVARHFPGNLNTAVGVALAGLGLDGTEAELVADPALSETAHELEIHAAPGTAVLRLGGREVPPDGDPADYTTFSLMRILRRRQARVMI